MAARRLGLRALLAGASLLAGAALSAAAPPVSHGVRSPRLEHLALVAADTRKAQAALLRQGDLAHVPPGWRPLSSRPDDSAPLCPWQDYAAFTITGRGEADFQPVSVGGAGFVGSSVDVFATAAQARGRFAVDTHAGTAACESEALRKAFGAGLETVSARQLRAPGVGEESVAFEFVYSQRTEPKRIYVNVVELVRGRSVAVVDFTNFDRPGSAATRTSLAKAVDARLS